MVAGAEGSAAAWLAICTIGLADGVEASEESRRLHGQVLFLQGALDLTREVFGYVGGDIADQGMQAGMDGGSVDHGETLTGVGPPSTLKVADGAGWRTGDPTFSKKTPADSDESPRTARRNKARGAFSTTDPGPSKIAECWFFSGRQSRPGHPPQPPHLAITQHRDL